MRLRLSPWSSKWTTLLTGGLQEWYHPIVEKLPGSLTSDVRIREHYMKWGSMRRTLIDNGARKVLAVLASAALIASIVHYGQYTIRQCKEVMAEKGAKVRLTW